MKFTLLALAVVVVGIGFASQTNAGTDMVTDNYAQSTAPTYNYAPPPRPVYYAPPPPVQVVVYPTYGYYRGVRFYGHHRYYRHGYYRHYSGYWH